MSRIMIGEAVVRSVSGANVPGGDLADLAAKITER
jgi:hypothetical protein